MDTKSEADTVDLSQSISRSTSDADICEESGNSADVPGQTTPRERIVKPILPMHLTINKLSIVLKSDEIGTDLRRHPPTANSISLDRANRFKINGLPDSVKSSTTTRESKHDPPNANVDDDIWIGACNDDGLPIADIAITIGAEIVQVTPKTDKQELSIQLRLFSIKLLPKWKKSHAGDKHAMRPAPKNNNASTMCEKYLKNVELPNIVPSSRDVGALIRARLNESSTGSVYDKLRKGTALPWCPWSRVGENAST